MELHFYRHLPHSPSRDADALNDADAHLSHEHEEEQHVVERAVAPEGAI